MLLQLKLIITKLCFYRKACLFCFWQNWSENTDNRWKESTSWYGITTYQEKTTSEVSEHVFIYRQNKSVKINKPVYDIQYCPKPVHKNNNYSIYKQHLS